MTCLSTEDASLVKLEELKWLPYCFGRSRWPPKYDSAAIRANFIMNNTPLKSAEPDSFAGSPFWLVMRSIHCWTAAIDAGEPFNHKAHQLMESSYQINAHSVTLSAQSCRRARPKRLFSDTIRLCRGVGVVLVSLLDCLFLPI